MKKVVRISLLFLLIFTLAIPALSASVADEIGVLSQNELEYLNEYTGNIHQEYGIGVYILLVDDYGRYSPNGYGDIFDVTADIYHSNGLGAGSGRDGILLLVDLTWREMAFFVYGDKAEYALDSYGQLLLEEAFIDDFREDRWYEGLVDFVETCENSFAAAERGEPIRESDAPMIGLIWVIAAVIAGITCAVCAASMKTARKQNSASAYVSGNGLNLSKQDDFFTHRTVTRVRKQQSSGSSGGRSHHSHGGSGRSSRF